MWQERSGFDGGWSGLVVSGNGLLRWCLPGNEFRVMNAIEQLRINRCVGVRPEMNPAVMNAIEQLRINRCVGVRPEINLRANGRNPAEAG
ncbi:hypothetical protein ACQ4M3_16750 [Leptolyngbya sp. AN03gr2]|uniref:hypothetical protein n=1 Tax=Leptolyngbya sp. AN03gr2 TaxID=3423364 RepID=UPI003D319CFE